MHHEIPVRQFLLRRVRSGLLQHVVPLVIVRTWTECKRTPDQACQAATAATVATVACQAASVRESPNLAFQIFFTEA